MAERRMADVVKQRQGFDQVLVEPQCPPQGPRQTGHLVRMRQTGTVIVPEIAGKDLHLAA
jgi:hypothetical protein